MRIKDLARFDGVREQPIIGYGIVVGLSGTGDSQRSVATLQSVSNMLREFGLAVPPYAVSSRNVAVVIVTADLPGAVRAGDRFDVNVAAMGDARSLAGGTLLMTPLMANNKVAYAMAQGPLAVGGYKFEQRGTSAQKNFPTAGTIPEGAIAQRSLEPELVGSTGTLELLLDEPDYTTATRVAAAINTELSPGAATAVDSGRVRVALGGQDKVGRRLDDGAHRIHRHQSRHRGARGGQRAHRHGGVRRRRLSIGGHRQPRGPAGLHRRAVRVLAARGRGVLGGSSGIRTSSLPEAEVHVSEDEATAVSLPHGRDHRAARRGAARHQGHVARRHRHPAGHQARRRAACRARHSVRRFTCSMPIRSSHC